MNPLYIYLVLWSLAVVVIGLLTLIVGIPFGAKIKSRTHTEFDSAKMGTWCVAVGLGLVALVMIGALVEHIIGKLQGGK